MYLTNRNVTNARNEKQPFSTDELISVTWRSIVIPEVSRKHLETANSRDPLPAGQHFVEAFGLQQKRGERRLFSSGRKPSVPGNDLEGGGPN